MILMDNTCVEERFAKDCCLTGVTLLRSIGERLEITESELKHFGLKYADTDGQMNWLSLSDRIKKHTKKLFQFQLGVRIYPEANEQLSENCLRLCCYQIKCDLNRGHYLCDPTQHAAIDSYFAQALIGDFIPKVHTFGYLEDFLGLFFMPPSGINCSAEVNSREYEMNVVKRHQGLSGMKTDEAWLAILNLMSTIPHFNVLKHRAKDSSDKTAVQISVCEQGVKIYKLNDLNEPDFLKRQYEWRGVTSFVCYNNKLKMSTFTGWCKFKFQGLYGDKAARRVLDDMLECRLFHHCKVLGTNLLAFHTEESKRDNERFSRRSSKLRSYRDMPVMQRKGSMRRVYSSFRLRFSEKRRRRAVHDGLEDNELGCGSRLSRIVMLPNE